MKRTVFPEPTAVLWSSVLEFSKCVVKTIRGVHRMEKSLRKEGQLGPPHSWIPEDVGLNLNPKW